VRTRDQPWQDGTPCWAELITPDPPAACTFYQAVFGWDEEPGVGPEPDGDGVFCQEDEPVAGIGRTPSDVPLAALWLIHFSTEDVDATVAAVQEHGGAVLHPPRDREGFGRSAIVADPTGAVFGVCKLVAPIGPEHPNEPGALITCDLRTSDARRAREFYSAVFGFRYLLFDETPGYTPITVPGDDDAVGGIGELDPGEDPQNGSHWLPYLSLDTDTDSAALKARWAGGDLQLGPYDTLGLRTAMLADPQGAVFAMMGDPAYPRPSES
jgi:predicted enzyme related to lactoylglutathione lyase